MKVAKDLNYYVTSMKYIFKTVNNTLISYFQTNDKSVPYKRKLINTVPF